MTTDEFLTEQEKGVFLATIEPIENDDKRVKVTPWRAGHGCLCQLSIVIPKEAIANVTPTGDRHPCCNKVLRVVEITFKEGSTMSLDEVFKNLLAGAQHIHPEAARPFEYGEERPALSSPNPQAFASEFFPGAETLLTCPPGQSQLACGGTITCQPNGTYCCAGSPCPAGWTCLACGGRITCQPPGSYCCAGNPCPQGYECFACGGQITCQPRGTYCCAGRPCPAGYRCVAQGGQIVCIR